MTTIEGETLTRRTLSDAERAQFVHQLFGLHFPMTVEPTVFGMAGACSHRTTTAASGTSTR